MKVLFQFTLKQNLEEKTETKYTEIKRTTERNRITEIKITSEIESTTEKIIDSTETEEIGKIKTMEVNSFTSLALKIRCTFFRYYVKKPFKKRMEN